VQVDPIKPTLKASGTKRFKLEYVKLLSTVAFEFNLRLYTKDTGCVYKHRKIPVGGGWVRRCAEAVGAAVGVANALNIAFMILAWRKRSAK